MTDLVLHLPLRIRNRVKKESYFYLNMNEYRNATFHELNDMKKKFLEMVENQIRPLPVFEWVTFKYIHFPGSARNVDTNNVCSIVDKFFSDAFVTLGKLEDDNRNFLRGTEFLPGEIDRSNPRVELHITGKIKEEQMQLQALLDHSDFMAAIDAYVRKSFPIPEGTTPIIDITAGRGDKGYSAVVTYASESDTQPAPSAATAALAASVKEQGSTSTRLGTDPLPKAEPAKEDPKPVESLPAEVVDEQSAELIEEEDDTPPATTTKPLFSL